MAVDFFHLLARFVRNAAVMCCLVRRVLRMMVAGVAHRRRLRRNPGSHCTRAERVGILMALSMRSMSQ